MFTFIRIIQAETRVIAFANKVALGLMNSLIENEPKNSKLQKSLDLANQNNSKLALAFKYCFHIFYSFFGYNWGATSASLVLHYLQLFQNTSKSKKRSQEDCSFFQQDKMCLKKPK
jgi:hypothetical protein